MYRSITILAFVSILAASCSNNNKEDFTESLSALTLNDDITFGQNIDEAILNDHVNFNILNKADNKEAYDYVTDVMTDILSSGLVQYSDSFEWTIRIIDDTLLNAFAAPGGKLYFYKSFIDYLEDGSQFAGVLAHLIAHIDKRQMSQIISDAYGENEILALLESGGANISYNQIALDLAHNSENFEFAISHEYSADKYSMQYLNDIKATKNYHCMGFGFFMQKAQADGHDGESFGFLANHPIDANRVQTLNELWNELEQPTGNAFEIEFLDFKTALKLKSKQVIFESNFSSDANLSFSTYYGELNDTAYAKVDESKIKLFASGDGKAAVSIKLDTINVDSVYLEIGFDKFIGQYYPWAGGDMVPVVSSHFAFNFNGKYLGIDSSIDDFTFNETVVQVIYHANGNELTVMEGNTNISEYFFIDNVVTALDYTSVYFNATSQQAANESAQCETVIDYIKIFTYN